MTKDIQTDLEVHSISTTYLEENVTLPGYCLESSNAIVLGSMNVCDQEEAKIRWWSGYVISNFVKLSASSHIDIHKKDESNGVYMPIFQDGSSLILNLDREGNETNLPSKEC